MYITKTGQVSKAAVYSTLNATWTIAFGFVGGQYQAYVIIYLILIYTGYSFINYDKKVAADKVKRAKVKVRFIKRVEGEYEVIGRKSINLYDDIDDEKLLDQISK